MEAPVIIAVGALGVSTLAMCWGIFSTLRVGRVARALPKKADNGQVIIMAEQQSVNMRRIASLEEHTAACEEQLRLSRMEVEACRNERRLAWSDLKTAREQVKQAEHALEQSVREKMQIMEQYFRGLQERDRPPS